MSKAATDALVINATKRPNPADKPPPGYSSVGSNWDKFDPVELQSMLLTAVMNNLRTPEEWHYLGRHALPIFLPAFVAATYRLMFDIKPEGGDLDAPQGSFMGVCFMLLRKSLQHPPSSSTCHPQSCLSAPTSLPPPPPPAPTPPASLAAATPLQSLLQIKMRLVCLHAIVVLVLCPWPQALTECVAACMSIV